MAIKAFRHPAGHRALSSEHDNRIAITYRATVDQPCPVNMTNHVYFNLDGEQGDVRQHQLQILAQRYLPVESDGIPGGELKDVANTSFDFRQPKTIAADFLADADQQKVKGYDHAFLLDAKGDASQPAAQVWSQDGKLQMTVYTSAPALQFYSGNYLGGTPSQTTEPTPTGRDWRWRANSCRIRRTIAMAAAGLCIRPGQEYVSLTEYQFIAR